MIKWQNSRAAKEPALVILKSTFTKYVSYFMSGVAKTWPTCYLGQTCHYNWDNQDRWDGEMGWWRSETSRGNIEKSRLSGFKRHKIEWTQFLEPCIKIFSIMNFNPYMFLYIILICLISKHWIWTYITVNVSVNNISWIAHQLYSIPHAQCSVILIIVIHLPIRRFFLWLTFSSGFNIFKYGYQQVCDRFNLNEVRRFDCNRIVFFLWICRFLTNAFFGYSCYIHNAMLCVAGN